MSLVKGNTRQPKKNLNTEELKTLDLKWNENIIILPVDKGNARMVLDTRNYKSITTDPTIYLKKTTKLNNAALSEETKKSIISREKSSKCAKVRKLPKIHNQDVPLTPVVSSMGSSTEVLDRYLANQPNSYGEQVTYVKNADHFINILRQKHVGSADMLVSFNKLAPSGRPSDKHKQHCLHTTSRGIDTQTEGTPMRSLLYRDRNRKQRDQTYTANQRFQPINRAFHVKTKPMHITTYVTKAYFPCTKGATDKIAPNPNLSLNITNDLRSK
ncbi:hypothetical protein Trydic_g13643 [Trypoxylus dichotomus]